jgi:putative GTP pyrophosphokinase
MSKKNKEDIKREAVDWYTKNRPTYKLLCQKVETIIKEILETEGVSIHTSTARAKEIISFSKKIDDPKYDNPQEQIKDFAGIRIIAYVESDLEKINKLVEDAFDVDPDHSLNKADELGIDKVGYKSVHYVARLKKGRLELPEYKKFKGLYFEIQIRTILQHAWAEIEHDKNYKFSGKLDDKIQRRFKILAGLLELADREFDSLANEIDKITIQVKAATESGELNITINGTTVSSYLRTRFSNLLEYGLEPTSISAVIIQELNDFGLKTLQDIESIIPKGFEKAFSKYSTPSTFVGLIRSLMIINDYKKYFNESWKNRFGAFDKGDEELFNHFNVPFEEISTTYKIPPWSVET